jgi:protein phosphatase
MTDTPIRRIGPEDGGNFEYRRKAGPWECHLLSDVGKRRARNEDSCGFSVRESVQPATPLLFAVADGMGGARGGAVASATALEVLFREFEEEEGEPTPKRLANALKTSNRSIIQKATNQPELEGMGTTVSAVAIVGDQVYVAHVGDSRVYLLRDKNGLAQITDDHSLVAEQVRNGLLTEEEARKHSMKNLITRAVGARASLDVDLYAVSVRRGDTLLLCSDGLCGVVDDETISAALSQDDLRGAGRTLIGNALDAGGPDNITAVIIRATDNLPASERENGAAGVELQNDGLFARIRRLFQ